MLGRLYAIADITFKETIRQPIYGIVVFATLFLLVINLALSAYTFDDDNKMLVDLGLSTLLVSGLFLSAFSATGVVSREIENQTALTVVTKPISRPLFLLGKYLGIFVAITMAEYLCLVAFLLTCRHKVLSAASDPYDFPVIVFGLAAVGLTVILAAFFNYMFNMNFMAATSLLAVPFFTLAFLLVAVLDNKWQLQPFGQGLLKWQIISASFLILMAVLVLAAIAVAASCRLGQVMTLVVCSGAMMIGVISDPVFGRFRDDASVHPVWQFIADLCYRVIPNLGFFWTADALIAGLDIPTAFVLKVSLYAILQITAIMLIGVALFQKRELG